MCPQDQWERLSKGLWIKSMSPFDHKVLDIRMGASYSENLQVSLDEGLSSMITFSFLLLPLLSHLSIMILVCLSIINI